MSLAAMARKAKEVMEPLVGMIYFVPEGPALYEKIGLQPRQAYFVTRASALGKVPPEVVVATFYNFNPAVVILAIRDQTCTPEQAAEARNQAVIESLTRLLKDEDGNALDVTRLVELVKKACSNLKVDGRPLFAAYYGQAWHDENPYLSLWWGCNLLREYRGDGHIAALVAEDISGIECTLISPAWVKASKTFWIRSRAWSENEMTAAYAGLQERGIMEGEELTEQGRALRDAIEARTDELALAPWRNLGEAETEEFLTLLAPITQKAAQGIRR
jgi:hypothetical protein